MFVWLATLLAGAGMLVGGVIKTRRALRNGETDQSRGFALGSLVGGGFLLSLIGLMGFLSYV
jgi:hypothetical protein